MLFLALIPSTGAGCAFAIVTRFKGIIAKWFKCSETISGVIIALVMMAIGVFGSQFGLTAIFSTGYGYLSKMAWPLGHSACHHYPAYPHLLSQRRAAVSMTIPQKLSDSDP